MVTAAAGATAAGCVACACRIVVVALARPPSFLKDGSEHLSLCSFQHALSMFVECPRSCSIECGWRAHGIEDLEHLLQWIASVAKYMFVGMECCPGFLHPVADFCCVGVVESDHPSQVLCVTFQRQNLNAPS